MLKTDAGDIIGTQVLDDRDILYTYSGRYAARLGSASDRSPGRPTARGSVLISLDIGQLHGEYTLETIDRAGSV
jgi:hypothetical protein